MMRRRDFLRSICAAGGAIMCRPSPGAAIQPSGVATLADPDVRRVLAVFKCHLDVGFTNTQAAVIQRYFTEYFPQAIRIASESRDSGRHRYVWTTGSWLLYEYLEQAAPDARKRMEQAITDGDIAWHALPFSWQSELLDASMIAGSLALSESLDRRFGRTTTGAKMSDVPGHTRGLIAPLAAHGIRFLDIGVNRASRPAEVPPLFVWKDRRGASLVVMYHPAYGSTLRVPDADVAVAVIVRGDNSGPHSHAEISGIYSDLTHQYPNAQITATTLTEVANTVVQYQDRLPAVTQEIGDTWIYGVPSDPIKIARYRALARLRRDWLARGRLQVGDAADISLLRRLLLDVEHTWGTDTKRWLDYDHYTRSDLESVLATPRYTFVTSSWQEKRQDLFDSIAALPVSLRDEAQAAIRSLDVREPPSKGSRHSLTDEIETTHFILGFDPSTGAIRRLRRKASRREWAAHDHPLALFSYQTLSEEDYDRFFSHYIMSTADWVAKDFGKPGIEKFGVESETWQAELSSVRVEKGPQEQRVLARLDIRDRAALRSGRASFPEKMYLELVLPDAEPVVQVNFYWFGKPSTRLPEALWLTFRPITSSTLGWAMDKSGEEVSPFDVVTSGNRQMHAVGAGIRYRDGGDLFAIEPLDAPVFALGEKSPLAFSKEEPDVSGGIHCSLFNNAWGTNYVQWFGEDMRFRFVLRG